MKRKPRPWVKYSQRVWPSARTDHAPGAVKRLRVMFDPVHRDWANSISRLFGASAKKAKP